MDRLRGLPVAVTKGQLPPLSYKYFIFTMQSLFEIIQDRIKLFTTS